MTQNALSSAIFGLLINLFLTLMFCSSDCNLLFICLVNYLFPSRILFFFTMEIIVFELSYKIIRFISNQKYLWSFGDGVDILNNMHSTPTIFLMRSILLIGFLQLILFHELNALNNLPFLLSLPSAFSNAWNILSNIVPFSSKDQQATTQQQCPLGQIHRCRCENILNLQQKRTIPMSWQILQHANQSQPSGEQELW